MKSHKRPEVVLSNYKEVYEFYGGYTPSRMATLALYGALGTIFAPKTVFAEGVEEEIGNTLASGRTLIIASTHIREVDPCAIAAAVYRSKVLKPMIGRSFIPAKSPIFHDLIPRKGFLNFNPILRRAVDGLHSVPVFRKKEYGNDPRLARASHELLKLCVAKIDGGNHMATFPEGERNTADPLQIQKIQSGVAHTVCGVEGLQPAITTVGIYYDPDDKLGRSPTVYFGEVSVEPFSSKRDVNDWLQVSMQASLDGAVQTQAAVV